MVSSAGVNMREWVRTRAQLSLESRKVNLLPFCFFTFKP